ncbi:unnamed protein product, partial [marine sediment metagenome]
MKTLLVYALIAPVFVAVQFLDWLLAIASLASSAASVGGALKKPPSYNEPELTWRQKMAEASPPSHRRPEQPFRNPYGVDERTWATIQRLGPQGVNSPFMQYLQKFL